MRWILQQWKLKRWRRIWPPFSGISSSQIAVQDILPEAHHLQGWKGRYIVTVVTQSKQQLQFTTFHLQHKKPFTGEHGVFKMLSALYFSPGGIFAFLCTLTTTIACVPSVAVQNEELLLHSVWPRKIGVGQKLEHFFLSYFHASTLCLLTLLNRTLATQTNFTSCNMPPRTGLKLTQG